MRHNYSRKRKLKKIFFIATFFAAAVVALSSYIISKPSSNDAVVAKINNHKILRSEVERKLHDIFDGQNQTITTPAVEDLPKEVFEILVKEVYIEQQIIKEAEKSKAVRSKETANKIADAKNKIMRQAYIEELIKEKVTDEKVNEKYLELTKELDGKKEYLVSHIVLKTEGEAENLFKTLKLSRNPAAKFSELAKKYSIDKDSAAKGGSLDYILEDNMVKEIAEVISNLQTNEISKPVQTKFGWHLIRIADVRPAQVLPFDTVKDSIREKLTHDLTGDLNSKITNNAKIEILIKLTPKAETSEEKASETAAPESEELVEVKATEEKSDQTKTQSDAKKKHPTSKQKD